LGIKNTDISSGLDYLPVSIKIFYCSANYRPNSQVKKICQELRKYGKPNGDNFANLLMIRKKDYLTRILQEENIKIETQDLSTKEIEQLKNQITTLQITSPNNPVDQSLQQQITNLQTQLNL